MDEELENYIQRVSDFANVVMQNESQLDPAFVSQVTQFVQSVADYAAEAQAQPVEIPHDAQLLWILSGGNPQAFVGYLRQFDTPVTQGLLSDVGRLRQIIQDLSETDPFQGIQQEINGVPKSNLQSSNVFGSEYDPKSRKLRVRFQKGGVYDYDGVSPLIAQLVQSGAASARTEGENEFGRWWQGKNPSLGASVNHFLKNTGIPYRRVA